MPKSTQHILKKHLSIRSKIMLSAAIPMLLMVVIALVVYENIEKTINTAKWVEHTHSVTAKGHHLIKLMLDMETGERGYLITGKPVFLEPFNSAKEAWDQRIYELKNQVSDNPSQVARIEEVERLQKQWLEQAADIEIAAREKINHTNNNKMASLDGVIQLIEKETGKQIIDRIRHIKDEFIKVEQALLIKRKKMASEAALNTKRIIIIGTIIAIFLASLTTLLTSASVLDSLKKLLIGTEKITAGDFDSLISIPSRDELYLLAESFNNMSASLKNSTQKMEEALLAKGEFLASMSHEIRTPMNGVLGMLGLLINTKLDEDQHHKALIAQSSAQSLLTLINDILDFSKIEAGKLTLEKIPFNLTQALEEVVESLGFQAQEKGLELILDISMVQQLYVNGDSNRLRQVLTNLVGNALKFTTIGEVILRASTVKNEKGGLLFTCHIIDTGIGIAPDKQASLFDSFTQADSSTTRVYGGTGLGLTICKRLTELMCGEISVTSEFKKGSCFTIEIPFDIANEQPLEVPDIDINELDILIVDDNKTNREVLRGLLEQWGADITEAVDGKQALQFCQARSEQQNAKFFDVAFLDMQMPVMSGADLGQQLQANSTFSEMKLVMMTSMGELGDNEYFSNLGFSAYFTKPTTSSDLLTALAIIVENRNALKQAKPLVTSQYIKSLTPRKTNHKQHWHSSTRILLVEDNKVNQMVAKSILEEYNLSVDIAEHGKEAISKLLENTYHLVFMDCQMPIMGGYETTQRIRLGEAGTSNCQIVIIAMTANAMLGDKEKCFDAGMDDYLSKPIDVEELLNMLNKWLTDDITPEVQPEIAQQTEIVVWDKKQALQRLMDNSNLLTAVVDQFIQEAPDNMAKITTAINELNWQQAEQVVHIVKSNTANISASDLLSKSTEFEQQLKDENEDRIKQLLPDFLDSYQTLISTLNTQQN